MPSPPPQGAARGRWFADPTTTDTDQLQAALAAAPAERWEAVRRGRWDALSEVSARLEDVAVDAGEGRGVHAPVVRNDVLVLKRGLLEAEQRRRTAE